MVKGAKDRTGLPKWNGLGPSGILIGCWIAFGLMAVAQGASAQGATATSNYALSQTDPFYVSLAPDANIPLSGDANAFSIGGGASLMCGFVMPPFRQLSLGGFVSGSLIPTQGIGNLSIIAGGGFARLALLPSPKLEISLFGEGGYFQASLLNSGLSPGYNPCIGGGAQAALRITPDFAIGLMGAYRSYLGLYSAPAFGLYASIGFGTSKANPIIIKIQNLQPVYPVLGKYYDDHAIGRATLTNTGNTTIDNIKLSLIFKEYMDTPKTCATQISLKPRESKTFNLFALFTNRILQVTQATKSAVEVRAEYVSGGKAQSATGTETARIYDRNALTWTDDRMASAFVGPKDPTVLQFVKNAISATKDKASHELNQNLLKAIAVHESLRLYGLAYVVDPNSAYSDFVSNKTAVDYLQYPNQTLQFKAGDCDDLSILYASLLESVGVDTAFITIPGHIFMAFSLGMPPEAARTSFSRPEDLILTDSDSWLPIEITERAGDFLQAWQEGAKEWRENNDKRQANFYPMQDSWRVYEPMGFSVDTFSLSMPDPDKIADAYVAEVKRYVNQEILPQVARLERDIETTNGAPADVNKLGVLYARYGFAAQAEEQFSRIVASQEYVPALVNLGNLRFLDKQMQAARDYYLRAQKAAPDSPQALLGVARASYELQDYEVATQAFDKLKSINSKLAAQFGYIEGATGDTSRAASVEEMQNTVVWGE
jgi:tetratricopeptide (TPR) repeat protein